MPLKVYFDSTSNRNRLYFRTPIDLNKTGEKDLQIDPLHSTQVNMEVEA